ncbi:unnamed protein product [Lactuca saligna]|uniref:Uncharacterized protein n=1 Tax=Lactuca saligna TaxID=75948 RepID=A0AA36EDU5_LACSI|nr:unnamed protein product [Lactuca saligna]
MISIPESRVTLPGFGPSVFSIDQLLNISYPVIGSSYVVSSSLAGVLPLEIGSPDLKRRQILSPDQFEQFFHKISEAGPHCASHLSLDHVALEPEELEKACRFIICSEKIISTILGRDLKFFDRLLTLRDCFLDVEVNLRVAEGMKLASEDMLVKAGEMYADL